MPNARVGELCGAKKGVDERVSHRVGYFERMEIIIVSKRRYFVKKKSVNNYLKKNLGRGENKENGA